MENALKRLSELNEQFDMSGFYSITIRPTYNEITLQGYFTDNNFDLARELGIDLTLQNNMLRGENEYYQITLTT
jgi:hypothetical protein